MHGSGVKKCDSWIMNNKRRKRYLWLYLLSCCCLFLVLLNSLRASLSSCIACAVFTIFTYLFSFISLNWSINSPFSVCSASIPSCKLISLLSNDSFKANVYLNKVWSFSCVEWTCVILFWTFFLYYHWVLYEKCYFNKILIRN